MVKTFPELVGNNGLFKDGDWVESKDQNPDGNVRLIQLADVGGGEFINKSSRFMTEKKANKLKCSFLEAGDILIARMPDPIGRACIFPGLKQKCVTVVDICIVRVDPQIVDRNWLVHFINSDACSRQIQNWITGTTRKRISRGNLSKVQIDLPPLEEQKRIAAILDKADALRRKREKAMALTDDLLRSVLLDMFGDPVTNPKGWKTGVLKDYVAGGDKINYGVVQPGKDFVGGVPLIRAGDIKNMSVLSENLKLISPDIEKSYKRSRIKGDEILISCVGAIGEIGLVTSAQEGFNIARAVARVRFNQDINRIFGAYMLNSPAIRSYFHKETRTVAQPTLNIKQITETPIIIPTIEKQNQFANLASKQFKIVEQIDSSLDKLDKLFFALTQKAFRGELISKE